MASDWQQKNPLEMKPYHPPRQPIPERERLSLAVINALRAWRESEDDDDTFGAVASAIADDREAAQAVERARVVAEVWRRMEDAAISMAQYRALRELHDWLTGADAETVNSTAAARGTEVGPVVSSELTRRERWLVMSAYLGSRAWPGLNHLQWLALEQPSGRTCEQSLAEDAPSDELPAFDVVDTVRRWPCGRPLTPYTWRHTGKTSWLAPRECGPRCTSVKCDHSSEADEKMPEPSA